jgi:hypothetical protein
MDESIPRRTGPRGGTTTTTKAGTLIRKTVYIHPDEEAALRREAYETRRSESEIIRELIRRRFKIED